MTDIPYPMITDITMNKIELNLLIIASSLLLPIFSQRKEINKMKMAIINVFSVATQKFANIVFGRIKIQPKIRPKTIPIKKK